MVGHESSLSSPSASIVTNSASVFSNTPTITSQTMSTTPSSPTSPTSPQSTVASPIGTSPGTTKAHDYGELDEYHLAAYCMLDALSGRDKHGHLTIFRQGWTVRAAFFFHTSEWELRLFYAFALLYTITTYLDEDHRVLSIAFVPPALLFFALDLFAKTHYMTIRDCFSKIWNAAEVTIPEEVCMKKSKMVENELVYRRWGKRRKRERERVRVSVCICERKGDDFCVLFIISLGISTDCRVSFLPSLPCSSFLSS